MIHLLKHIFKKKESKEIIEGIINLENDYIALKGKSETIIISEHSISKIERIYIESYEVDYVIIEIAVVIKFKNKDFIVLDYLKGFQTFCERLFEILEVEFNLDELYRRETEAIRIYPK